MVPLVQMRIDERTAWVNDATTGIVAELKNHQTKDEDSAVVPWKTRWA